MNKKTEAGGLIHKYSNEKGISIMEISKRTKMSYGFICKCMRGEKIINDKNYNKICNALNLNRTERNELKEAVFISNSPTYIDTTNKKVYILKFIYLLCQRSSFITQEQINQCIKIIGDKPGEQQNSKQQKPYNQYQKSYNNKKEP